MSLELIDLDNAKTDVTHIAAIATSASSTATDRLGQTKRTVAGMIELISGTLGMVAKPTRADLFADLAYREGTVGWVMNDSTPAYNLMYRKTGAMGAGGWLVAGDGLLSQIQTKLATLQNVTPAYLTSVGGSANTITASASNIASIAEGTRVTLVPAVDNTGAATLAVNGLGAYAIQDGYGGPVIASSLKAGRFYDLVFVLPGNVWKIVGYGETREQLLALQSTLSGVGTQVSNLRNLSRSQLTIGGTADAITGSSAALVSVIAGTTVLVLPTADNTGAATLAVNGGAAYAIQDGYGGPLAANSLRNGRYYEMVFTGSVWKITAYGDDHEKLRALQNSSASMLTSVAGTNTITGTSAAISSIANGTRVLFAPANDNTAGATLNVNGLGAYTLADGYGGAVVAGALKAGRYYEAVFFAAGGVWQIIGYGIHHEWLRSLRNYSAPSVLTSVAGTNTITATSSAIDAIGAGTRVTLSPAVDNTGAATLNINGLGAYAIQDGYGGAIVAGTLKAGRIYELVFNGVGSVWKIIVYGDDRNYLRSLFAGATTVSGTANAIALAAENYPQKGMLLYFVPTATNTAAVTLNVTAPAGSTGALSLLKGANAPLVAGDLPANVPVLAIYEGAPGNTWKLLTIAGTAMPGTSLADTALATLNALVTVTPFGTQTYVAGVMTQVDNDLALQGGGSSVGNGEGARHPNDPAGNSDWAPVARLSVNLGTELGLVGRYNITYNNTSVNGSFDNELPTQFAARGSGFTTGRIYLPTPGMNAATAFGQLSAATMPGQINGLRTACQNALSAGYLPILQTTMHPHPYLEWQASAGGLLNTWSWPTPTLNLTVPFTVDATARTISGSYLTSYGPFGGTKLSPGSKLRFGAGPNSGVDLFIESIPAADTVKIAAGPTLTSETASRQLVHFASAAENESLMPLPPSKRYARGNRSGAGETMGLRLFDLYNAEIVTLSKELRLPIMMIDLMSFDYIVANGGDSLVWNESTKTMSGSAPGWDAGYTTSYPGYSDVKQQNHPNIAHRTATFDLAGRKLGRLLRHGELTRDTVIR